MMNEILACAAGIESYPEHPLAQAIVAAANDENLAVHAVENFQAVPGKRAKADCVVCYDSHQCIGKLPHSLENSFYKSAILE